MKPASKVTLEGPGAISSGPSPLDGGELLGSYKTIQALGRWLTFPPQLARAIGMEEAIFLINFIFLASDEQEWVERNSAQLENETTLTYKQQTRVRDHLVRLGLLEVRSNRLKHETFYRVVEERWDALIAILRRKREFDELTFGSNSTLPKVNSTNLPKVSSNTLKELKKEEKSEERTSLPLLCQEERRAIPKPVKELKVRKGLQRTVPIPRFQINIPMRLSKQPESWVWFSTVFKHLSDVNAVTMQELWPMVDEMLAELSREEAENRLSVYIQGASKISGFLAKDFLAGGWRTVDEKEAGDIQGIVNEE